MTTNLIVNAELAAVNNSCMGGGASNHYNLPLRRTHVAKTRRFFIFRPKKEGFYRP